MDRGDFVYSPSFFEKSILTEVVKSKIEIKFRFRTIISVRMRGHLPYQNDKLDEE